jgi:serine/threonine protein kinase
MSAYLKGIPGWERYYIVEDKDECNAKNFQEYKRVYREQCEKIHKIPDEKLVQLIAPYGGKMLFETAITPKFNFLGSLRHMLEGVERLAKQGICHYDLHDGNIVVDYHGTLRIIDFGSAFLGDQTTDEVVVNHTYEFSPDYPPLSPEVTIQQGLVQGISIPLAIQQTIEQKKIFRRAEAILGLSRWQQQKDIESFFRDIDYDNTIDLYKTYWRKWDSWAVGVLFVKILEKSFLLPGFVAGVWAMHGPAIRNVLRGLVQADPRKRFTAKEALELFNKTIVE